MNDNIKKLEKIGIKKIHEDTHIAVKYIQAILYESFEDTQKVQLLGFMSILEREYDIDLSELKEKAKQYFEENQKPKINYYELEEKNKDYKTLYYIIFAKKL